MIPRVLEPEAMDTAAEAADYDAMDHAEVNTRFVSDFLAAHGPCRGGPILDLGTGPGRIPIALCQADPKAQVVGVDLAEHMLALARSHVAKAGLSERIACERADGKQLPFPAQQFEAVISNTIIHHIPEPDRVLAEIVRVLAPGGTVFVRDLARPNNAAEIDRLVALYAGGEAAAAQELFAASLHAALTVDEVRGLIEALGLRAQDVVMTSDRHWTWTWRRPS